MNVPRHAQDSILFLPHPALNGRMGTPTSTETVFHGKRVIAPWEQATNLCYIARYSDFLITWSANLRQESELNAAQLILLMEAVAELMDVVEALALGEHPDLEELRNARSEVRRLQALLSMTEDTND